MWPAAKRCGLLGTFSEGVQCAAFSADKCFVAVSNATLFSFYSKAKKLAVWEIANGKKLWEINDTVLYPSLEPRKKDKPSIPVAVDIFTRRELLAGRMPSTVENILMRPTKSGLGEWKLPSHHIPRGQLLNGETVSRPPYASMYWSPAQMLAHLTATAPRCAPATCSAPGTVSGPAREQRGSLLELSWGGTGRSTVARQGAHLPAGRRHRDPARDRTRHGRRPHRARGGHRHRRSRRERPHPPATRDSEPHVVTSGNLSGHHGSHGLPRPLRPPACEPRGAPRRHGAAHLHAVVHRARAAPGRRSGPRPLCRPDVPVTDESAAQPVPCGLPRTSCTPSALPLHRYGGWPAGRATSRIAGDVVLKPDGGPLHAGRGRAGRRGARRCPAGVPGPHTRRHLGVRGMVGDTAGRG